MVAFLVWSAVLGFLLGSVTVTLLQSLLPDGAMESYGWRIPFLIAAPLGLVGLYIRMRLTDTPAFEAPLGIRQGGRVPAAGGHHHRAGRDPSGHRGDDHPTTSASTSCSPICQRISSRRCTSPGSVVPVHHGGQRGGAGADPSAGRPFGPDRAAPLLITGAAGFAVLAYPAFLLLNSGSLATAILAHCLLAAVEAVFVSVSLVAATNCSPPGCATAACRWATTSRWRCSAAPRRTWSRCWRPVPATTTPPGSVVIAAVVSLLTVLTMRESAGRPLAALGAPRAGLTAPTAP